MEGTGHSIVRVGVDIGEGDGQKWLPTNAMVVSLRALHTSPAQRAERRSAARVRG